MLDHPRLLLLAIATSAASLACDRAPDQSAAPAPQASASAGTNAPAGAEARPPSGMYDVTKQVVVDTCSSSQPPATTARLALFGKLVRGLWVLNLPVPLDRPAVEDHGDPPTARARRDVVAIVGEGYSEKLQPHSLCPTHIVKREVKVTEVARDRVKLVSNETYEGSGSCPSARAPVDCRMEVAYTFALVESKCEAPCAGQGVFTSSGLEIACRCP